MSNAEEQGDFSWDGCFSYKNKKYKNNKAYIKFYEIVVINLRLKIWRIFD
jgi:hypothetical protein